MIGRCLTHSQRVDIDEKIENKVYDRNFIGYDRVTTIKCAYCEYVYVVKYESITYKFTETLEKDGTVCFTLSKPEIQRKEY